MYSRARRSPWCQVVMGLALDPKASTLLTASFDSYVKAFRAADLSPLEGVDIRKHPKSGGKFCGSPPLQAVVANLGNSWRMRMRSGVRAGVHPPSSHRFSWIHQVSSIASNMPCPAPLWPGAHSVRLPRLGRMALWWAWMMAAGFFAAKSPRRASGVWKSDEHRALAVSRGVDRTERTSRGRAVPDVGKYGESHDATCSSWT